MYPQWGAGSCLLEAKLFAYIPKSAWLQQIYSNIQMIRFCARDDAIFLSDQVKMYTAHFTYANRIIFRLKLICASATTLKVLHCNDLLFNFYQTTQILPLFRYCFNGF